MNIYIRIEKRVSTPKVKLDTTIYIHNVVSFAIQVSPQKCQSCLLTLLSSCVCTLCVHIKNGTPYLPPFLSDKENNNKMQITFKFMI